MAYYKFEDWRVSGDGNAAFPDEIIIDDEEEVVIHRKPKLIGRKGKSRETRRCLGFFNGSKKQRRGNAFVSFCVCRVCQNS